MIEVGFDCLCRTFVFECHARLYALNALPSSPFSLVLPSRRLTRLKLIKIPATDGQTPLVIIHALAEALDIIRARSSRRLLHCSGVGGLVLRGELGGLRGGFSGRGGAAAEPAADCVAD